MTTPTPTYTEITPDHIADVLRLLTHYTKGTYDIWSLAGPSNARIRAQIMSLLRKIRVPQSQAGVTALEAACYELAGVMGRRNSERQGRFVAWARAQVERSGPRG